MHLRRSRTALAALALAAGATVVGSAATAAAEQPRASAHTQTSVAGGVELPATVTADWDSVRRSRGRLSLAGRNAPITTSVAAGRLRLDGPWPAGPLCVARAYIVQGDAQTMVGEYSNKVRVRRADGRNALVAAATDRYLVSPPGLLYEVNWAMEATVPRLRSGDTAVWSFGTSFSEAVTDYQETVTVRRASCPG